MNVKQLVHGGSTVFIVPGIGSRIAVILVLKSSVIVYSMMRNYILFNGILVL